MCSYLFTGLCSSQLCWISWLSFCLSCQNVFVTCICLFFIKMSPKRKSAKRKKNISTCQRQQWPNDKRGRCHHRDTDTVTYKARGRSLKVAVCGVTFRFWTHVILHLWPRSETLSAWILVAAFHKYCKHTKAGKNLSDLQLVKRGLQIYHFRSSATNIFRIFSHKVTTFGRIFPLFLFNKSVPSILEGSVLFTEIQTQWRRVRNWHERLASTVKVTALSSLSRADPVKEHLKGANKKKWCLRNSFQPTEKLPVLDWIVGTEP